VIVMDLNDKMMGIPGIGIEIVHILFKKDERQDLRSKL